MILVLHGDWDCCPTVIMNLLQAGFTLFWRRVSLHSNFYYQPAVSIDFYLLRSVRDLPENHKGWVGWDITEESSLSTIAYQRGAAVVFPKGISSTDLINTLRILFPAALSAVKQPVRHFRADAVIFLEADQILRVDEGVIASFIVQRDGKRTLTGLFSNGQVVLPHPADDCHLELVAYTDVRASLFYWQQISGQPDFIQSLRQRLYLTEAWASAQSQLYLEDRLLRILQLIAEQFGKPDPQGSLIDLRLTHQLLAGAIGANRTTVTRLLANLKKRGLLLSSGRGKNERLILTKSVNASHTIL